MRRRLQSFLGDRSGAAAIEFAFAVVPLIILLFGGITYAGVLASKLALEHAAAEGARAGIAGLSICERQERAETSTRDALLFGAIAAAAVVNVTVTAEQIRVEVDFDYAANPVSPAIFPVPDLLKATVIVLTDGPELPADSC